MLAVVLTLARWVRSAATLLLIGVMVGAAGTAVVSVLLVYADPQRVEQYLLWGLGSFAGTTWPDLRLLLPVVAAGMAAAALTVRALNALLLGESYARTMGIRRATGTANHCRLGVVVDRCDDGVLRADRVSRARGAAPGAACARHI